ncbi:MAG: cyclic nucleotide-binding protein [Firmicutes bacterium]|nr:cyclic nucleotide-binding protein [Bacillota bacterium]
MKRNNLEKITSEEEMIGEGVQICIANTLAEKKAIYQFRYKIYVEEMAKDKLNLIYHDKEISDKMDEWGILIYVKNDKEVVGTARLNFGKISDFPEEIVEKLSMKDFYEYCVSSNIDDQVAFVSKFIVAEEFRSSSVAYLMLIEFYKFYFEKGGAFFFAGCNLHLLRFYEKMGCHRYGKNFNAFGYGLLCPIVALAEDVNHFRTIRSPLFRIAGKKITINSKNVEWFHEKFTEKLNIVNSQLVTTDELWSILCERLHALPTEVIEILHDLSIEEAKKFLHACGSIVQCAPGEAITVQGDVSYSYNILLSGRLKSLTFINPIKEYHIPGQYFGANGLTEHHKHLEEIVTVTQSEILVLTGFTFPKFSKANLDIAHKIMKKIITMARNPVFHLK